jgi:hypothetical protein
MQYNAYSSNKTYNMIIFITMYTHARTEKWYVHLKVIVSLILNFRLLVKILFNVVILVFRNVFQK